MDAGQGVLRPPPRSLGAVTDRSGTSYDHGRREPRFPPPIGFCRASTTPRNPFAATVVSCVPTNRLRGVLANVNDGELVAAVLRGESDAERMLYDRHVDRLYRLAYRMSGDETLARDFVQDAFVRAFDKLGDFRGESSLATWLHSVTSSVVLNGLKKVKRIRAREEPDDELAHVASAERHAEPDLKVKLARAIDGLPDGYRTVFVMHDVEGYTHEEIGQALGIQAGTSKAQLFRARARLRMELAEFAGEWTS
jgi:RNA polymerase sigma-70 factor (ECF subfamily)